VDKAAGQEPRDASALPCHRRVEKPWGWEIIWADTAQYTAKLIHVHAGKRLSLQFHDEKLETQCLLSGRATLIVGNADGSLGETEMEIGKGYTIREHQIHRLVATQDSELVEVSTPERGTTVRLEDDFCRPDETEAIRALPGRGWEGS
jgi:mannose-6-phosphate isomerase